MSLVDERVPAPAAGLAVTALLASVLSASVLPGAPAHAAPARTAPRAAGVPIALPPPTGRHPIGTADLHLVAAHQDPWRPSEKRELMVTVTYPAQGGGERAPWLPPGVADVFDRIDPSLPPGAVDWAGARRHARTSAPVDRSRGGWPVVLFSHGFGTQREFGSVLADDLAAHGYVVVSVSHTHEAGAVEFPGGRVVTRSVGSDPAALRTALDARVADSRFVLDVLARLDRGENPDAERDPLPRGLAGSLDLSAVGMFGHSYGGFTAGETMYHDRRVDAGINLDGGMAAGDGNDPGKIVQHGVDGPFLLVGSDIVDPATGRVHEHSHLDTELDPTWNRFWANQRAWKRDLHFDGAAHNSFTDLQAVVPQLSHLLTPEQREQMIGDIDPRRSLRAQRDYVAAFFDLHLKHRDRHLFRHDNPRHPDTRFIT